MRWFAQVPDPDRAGGAITRLGLPGLACGQAGLPRQSSRTGFETVQAVGILSAVRRPGAMAGGMRRLHTLKRACALADSLCFRRLGSVVSPG